QQNICNQITAVVDSLCKRVNNKPEDELDVYILPHPLLGKLTLREMLYFTIYHAEHHLKNVEELIEKRN
ncbi:MAG TPA: DinB family protein, partial [Chitinophagaceae bacterium]|nr:DinB family protein [Chitinophagaceae bacterium]